MKAIVLDEQNLRHNLFPFTCIRHVADIRIGILTLREKWERLGFRIAGTVSTETVSVPAGVVATQVLKGISPGQLESKIKELPQIVFPWHIFQLNANAIRSDFELITNERSSASLHSSNRLINPENIFVEKGAKANCSIINAEEGPVYLGANATIMEGSIIRGPVSIGEGAVVKMGACIYGGTTIGPYCVVGGEIKNAVLFGFSNKSHHGYLGDSVVGEWCNLGAGTSNSNLKNSAGDVKVWNDMLKLKLPAGSKCGLLMGDYSRSAINTSFNTGTVTGIACNVFGNGLTPVYIPHFSRGYSPVVKYQFDKAIAEIENWKKLKNHALNEKEIQILKTIFDEP